MRTEETMEVRTFISKLIENNCFRMLDMILLSMNVELQDTGILLEYLDKTVVIKEKLSSRQKFYDRAAQVLRERGNTDEADLINWK